MLGGFWSTLALTPLILAALASPLFIVARREGRHKTIRNFALSGAALTVAIAVLELVSDRQVEQCLEAGNPSCLDSGTPSLQLLFIFVYVVAALWSARVIREGG